MITPQQRILLLTLVILSASCTHSVSYQDALSENQEEFASKKAMDDASSLVEIESLNLLALEVFQLAMDTGYSSLVVAFAEKGKIEHQQLQADIKSLAGREEIILPDLLSQSHGEMLSRLRSAARQDFDSEFIQSIRAVNDSLLSLFTKKAIRAADPDIRAFTARRLDILNAHKRSIDAIGQSLLQTSR